MGEVLKAVACVIQEGSLLCFRHPLAGNQVPKGTVEPGELPEHAVVRELFEETGVVFSGDVQALAVLEHERHGASGDVQIQRWHLFLLPVSGLPPAWTHGASGSEAEDGLCFECFWQPLELPAVGFHESFEPVIERVREAVLSRSKADRRIR